ncbi:MAG: hypothetical protein FWG97_02790 [Deltaproteobacteria bacterium]|nr:hypothetical protein [Deltaproteobacteria bacterium]
MSILFQPFETKGNTPQEMEQGKEPHPMRYAPHDILTLAEAAAWYKVDRRTLKKDWAALGGMGLPSTNSCRIIFSDLVEGLKKHADKTKRQERSMAGQGLLWGADGGLKDVSSRPKRRPRMAGGQGMGRGAEAGHIGETGDPFDLISIQ